METQYNTKKWASAVLTVVLAFTLLFLGFLYIEGGIIPFFSIITGYYGIILIVSIFLYFKIGLWSIFPLYIVALTSLAKGVFKNSDVYEVFIQDGALHTISFYVAALTIINIYLIFHTPQITITNTHLILSHGKTTIDWNNITEIKLAGGLLRVNRDIFTFFPILEEVTLIENQSDLINTLSHYCHGRDIPFTVDDAPNFYRNFGVAILIILVNILLRFLLWGN